MAFTIDDYKVGDKVRVVSHVPHDRNVLPHFTDEMEPLLDIEGVVNRVTSDRGWIIVGFSGDYYSFLPHWLIPLKYEPVHTPLPRRGWNTFGEFILSKNKS